MAQIISFPQRRVKHSNYYNNLNMLFEVASDNATLEGYAEIMAVGAEEGAFLPGELEALTEQFRRRRLDLAKPEKRPAEDVTKPGLYSYCPEMGEQKPECQIDAHRSYYGKHFFIDTPLELKGRGITKDGVINADQVNTSGAYKAGWFRYTVTERAFEKLKEQYSISQEMLLD
jgi:hypothetical protein